MSELINNPQQNATLMFEPFKYKGMQYLAIPEACYVRIVSFIGEDFGLYHDIKSFKKCTEKWSTVFTKISIG
tara:strand:- start:3342 stop:3557 length:216 start_codon:yes stop_codon:yes gene_type:complete